MKEKKRKTKCHISTCGWNIYAVEKGIRGENVCNSIKRFDKVLLASVYRIDGWRLAKFDGLIHWSMRVCPERCKSLTNAGCSIALTVSSSKKASSENPPQQGKHVTHLLVGVYIIIPKWIFLSTIFHYRRWRKIFANKPNQIKQSRDGMEEHFMGMFNYLHEF